MHSSSYALKMQLRGEIMSAPSALADRELVEKTVKLALAGQPTEPYTDEIRARAIAEITERIIFTECTCTPLDGGLGATTCQVCKEQAGSNPIEF